MAALFHPRHLLAASVTSLVLASLLPAPARAGGTLAYHYTEITSSDLSTPGTTVANSRATGITNAGVVVGVYDLHAEKSPPYTGYEYDTHTAAVSTLTYGKPDGSEFDAVSGGGSYVLGDYANFKDPNGLLHYYTYHNGSVSALPDPFGEPSYVGASPDGNQGYYTGVNDNGATVGYYSADGGFTESGFLRGTDGSFTSLQDPNDDLGSTSAYAINASGTVVGTYINSVTHANGFLRDAAGNYTTFDVPGARNTDVFGISDNGNLIGDYNTFRGGPYDNWAFVDGVMYTGLDVPGADSTFLYGINDAGQIAGYDTLGDGSVHSFYASLVPVPEAGTLLGFGLGLPLLALLAIRRRVAARG